MNKHFNGLTGGRKNASFFGKTFFQRRKKCHRRGVVVAMPNCGDASFLARLFSKKKKCHKRGAGGDGAMQLRRASFFGKTFFQRRKKCHSEGESTGARKGVIAIGVA